MVELKLAADNVSGNESLRLPRNTEAEAALIGALLIDNRIAEDVQQKLKPEHFHDPLHGRIYELILKLLDKNMVANAVTLRPMLENEAGMTDQGGAGKYLADISANSISVI
ncbi:MAG: DnaB-like helicase N-terminal domain-containing protein, partial [Sphingobium sp.]